MNPSPITTGGRIAQPCKCKICGETIGHYAVTWPPEEGDTHSNMQFKQLFEDIAAHMKKQRFDPKTHQPDQRHMHALGHASMLGGNLVTLFLSRHFQLPEGANGFVEQLRGSVHHMTSKFSLTEANAKAITAVILMRVEEVLQRHLDLKRPPDPEVERMKPECDNQGWTEDADQELRELISEVVMKLAARYEEGHPTKGDPKAN